MTKVAIGAIMKQEAPYILEWVAYHKALGFDLIIADNGGQDDTSKLLTALHNAKVITRMDFRFRKTVPQIPAYIAILRFARKFKFDILGFLDCDEFFTRYIPIQSLRPEDGAEYIKAEFESRNATQLSFHWLCYGSNSNFTDLSLPVIERFSEHANIEERRNVWVKSFVKVEEMFKSSNIKFLGPKVLNVHYFPDVNKHWFIDNEKVTRFDYGKKISYKTGAVLHYQGKTWEEYKRKIARGDADHQVNINNKEYFDRINLNNDQSKVDEDILLLLRSCIQHLKDKFENFDNAPPKITFFEKFRINLLSFGLSNVRGNKLSLFLYRIYKKSCKQIFSRINKLS